MYEFNAGEGGLRGVERLEPQHRPGDPLYCTMVLLHDVIEILGLADDDRGAVFLVVALDGRFVGRTPIDGDFLGHSTMTTNRFGQKPLGRLLIAMLGEEK